MVLGTAEYNVWWLGFVGWVPLLMAVRGLSPAAAFRYGWLAGTVTVFIGFRWMNELLERFADFPFLLAVPVSLLFATWHGLLWGVWAGLLRGFERRTTAPLWLVGPLAWVVVEAFIPNLFPIYMAQIWATAPRWAQVAELGGVTTIGFVMVLANMGFAQLLFAALDRKAVDRTGLAVVAAVLGLVPAYGTWRMASIDQMVRDAKTLRFGVVQGNMSIEQMHSRSWRPRILAEHQRMSAELEAQGAEVLLWGETAYPFARTFVRASTHDAPEDSPYRVRRGFRSPLIFGTITTDETEQNPYPWNSALLLEPDGRISARYDKVYPLAFGEYVPLVDPEWFLELVPAASHLNRGPGPDVMSFGEYRLGPFICYEDILPRFVREAAEEGVHAFVNLTNDSWFGKTHEPAQHLGLAVFRAIEQRRAIVRAVNTGISSYVDPAGRIHHATAVVDPLVDGPKPAQGFVVDVPMIPPDEGVTLYRRTGEAWNVLCLVALAGLGVARRRRDVVAG